MHACHLHCFFCLPHRVLPSCFDGPLLSRLHPGCWPASWYVQPHRRKATVNVSLANSPLQGGDDDTSCLSVGLPGFAMPDLTIPDSCVRRRRCFDSRRHAYSPAAVCPEPSKIASTLDPPQPLSLGIHHTWHCPCPDTMAFLCARPFASHRHSRVGFHTGGARARVSRGEEETRRVRSPSRRQTCISRAEQRVLVEDLLCVAGDNLLFGVFQSHIPRRLTKTRFKHGESCSSPKLGRYMGQMYVFYAVMFLTKSAAPLLTIRLYQMTTKVAIVSLRLASGGTFCPFWLLSSPGSV